MMFKTHATSGAALWLAGCAVATIVHHPPGILAVVAGTPIAVLFTAVPDLDHRSGRASKSLGPITWLLSRALIVLSQVVHAATMTKKDRPNGSGHRALTHTLLFCVALGGLVSGVLKLTGMDSAVWLGLPVGVGALAHLLGDACTKDGVPLWFPIKINGQRWYSFGLPSVLRCRTDKKAEHRFWMPLFALICAVAGFFILVPL